MRFRSPGIHRLYLTIVAATFVAAGCGSSPGSSEVDSGDPLLVVVEENAHQVTVLDVRTGTPLHRIQVDSLPHEVEVTEDGRTAFVSNFGLRDYDLRLGTPGKSIAIIDLKEGSLRGHLWLAGDSASAVATASGSRAPHGVKLRPPDEHELFVNAEVGDSMIVFDVATLERIRAFPIPSGTHNFVFSADGAAVWLMAADAGLYRLDPGEGSVTGRIQTSTPVRGLTWMPDSTHLVVSGRDEILFVNVDRLTIERRIGQLGVGQVLYSAVTPDGRFVLAPAPRDSQVVVVDLETGHPSHRLRTGRAPIRVLVDSRGALAYVANAEDDHVSVVDLQDWTVRSLGSVDGPNGLALIP